MIYESTVNEYKNDPLHNAQSLGRQIITEINSKIIIGLAYKDSASFFILVNKDLFFDYIVDYQGFDHAFATDTIKEEFVYCGKLFANDLYVDYSGFLKDNQFCFSYSPILKSHISRKSLNKKIKKISKF